MIETAAKRRRPRPPAQGCAAVDRRSGIRDCTGCGYYRPLSADLLLGMACHYSLDTGQLREVPPAVCFRRALHRARRPGPGNTRKMGAIHPFFHYVYANVQQIGKIRLM